MRIWIATVLLSASMVGGCGSDVTPQEFSSSQSKTLITAINRIDGMVAAGKCRRALQKQQQLTQQTKQLFPSPGKVLRRATLKSLAQLGRLIRQDCEKPEMVEQPKIEESQDPVVPIPQEPEPIIPEEAGPSKDKKPKPPKEKPPPEQKEIAPEKEPEPVMPEEPEPEPVIPEESEDTIDPAPSEMAP